MAYYLVESYDFVVEHGSQRTEGVVGVPEGSEKIYLHLLELTDEEIARLGPRVDEDGNKQHARLALPRNEEWWVAVEGEVFWPKVFRPKLGSSCDDIADAPRPKPLSNDDLALLRKSGVGKVPA